VLDVTGLPALDLAIGLAFIFFLLSTLAATIQEFIAAILGLRARTLEQGLRSLLEDPEKGWSYVDKFYDHELIKSLYRTKTLDVVKEGRAQTPPAAEQQPPQDADAAGTEVAEETGKNKRSRWFKRPFAFFKRTSGPSYVSPRAFALVVLDNFGEEAGESVLEGLPPRLQKRLKPLMAGPQQDLETMRTNLEAWYDDAMARVSGWYKRKTQIILIVIGIALVPAINAIKMGERMWKDDTVRAAVVAQAQAIASPTPTSDGEDAGATPTSAEKLKQAADDVDGVVKVGIPMGWRGDAVPRGEDEIAMAIGGWLLTILAISLGAPFWFDTLGRLSRLRSSGKPETPLPATSSGKVNERIVTPPQVSPVVLQQAPDAADPGQGEGDGAR
jgi:hypothetical protein